MKSPANELQSRGYVDESIFKQNSSKNIKGLEEQLNSNSPVKRTEAAMTIKQLNLAKYIPQLLGALQKEKKLYCKIALSDALAGFRDKSIIPLIPFLGTIGNNQHKKLPEKTFKKNSYPLPRDIIARTLIKIGPPAIPYLLKEIKRLSRHQVLEAIDVLGHISFNTGDKRSLPALLDLYHKTEDDDVMTWKLLRAFSAFNDKQVTDILNTVIKKSRQKEFIREAERSLGLHK